jgi:hypothetical protein
LISNIETMGSWISWWLSSTKGKTFGCWDREFSFLLAGPRGEIRLSSTRRGGGILPTPTLFAPPVSWTVAETSNIFLSPVSKCSVCDLTWLPIYTSLLSGSCVLSDVKRTTAPMFFSSN